MFNNAKYYFNRELSWLKFNQRVLLESIDTNTPLLERLRFIAIASSLFGKIDALSGGAIYIETLHTGSKKISCECTHSLGRNLSLFIVASVKCRGYACVFFCIFHSGPF